MRTVLPCLLLAALCGAGTLEAVDDATAQEAIKEFNKAFKVKDIDSRQNAVYNLHDVPSDLVIKRIEKLLRDRSVAVRNVAALAMGGQAHNVPLAGAALMRAYKKEYKNVEVLSSVLDAMGELKYMGYWPTVKKALKDPRSSVIIRILDMFGVNKDYRVLPTLLDMYKVAMPKGAKWTTGVVNVDTGTAGDADAKAAKAKWTAKYGAGGSKARAKATAKAKAFDERSFATQLRKCVKAITGEDFDNSIDFEDWYVENYVKVMRRIAELDGKSPVAAESKAKLELPALEKRVEEERKKLEAELEEQRRQREGKQ